MLYIVVGLGLAILEQRDHPGSGIGFAFMGGVFFAAGVIQIVARMIVEWKADSARIPDPPVPTSN
jgi:hypothetical protein